MVLARAAIDHRVAVARLEQMQAARAAKLEAAQRGEQLKGPMPRIEPVFGDRKHNRQIRRFRRRGINAVRSEWAFIHLAGNILKLYQHHSTVAIA